MSEPSVFVQWKGTDACLDFWCSCLDEETDNPLHFDGYTFGTVRCPRCGTVWEIDPHPTVRKSDMDPVRCGAVLQED